MVAAGGNDMLFPTFNPARTEREVEAIVAPLAACGALVLTCGLFDITRSSLVPDEHRLPLRERLHALSALTERVARRHGVLYVDLTSHPAPADDGIYSADGVHINGRGHYIAATQALSTLVTHPNSNETEAA